MSLQKEINNERCLLFLLGSSMATVFYGLISSSVLLLSVGAGVLLLCASILSEFDGKATPISNKIVNWDWSK